MNYALYMIIYVFTVIAQFSHDSPLFSYRMLPLTACQQS